MTDAPLSPPPPAKLAPALPALLASMSVPQTTSLHARFGKRGRVEMAVSVTPAGLLAIGGLVAAILLSVPPTIRAAKP
jgi:hypothetical protein